ncbi:F-box/kelch-repeat protein At3g23880-like [Lycium ferocissimum]|uniref:F-box/kelch-repeat protein At3g23880-like n=1 Tax=Lycium ferocissimum TaxID=112874 RepID=UPI002814D719|nr:F-box/kelch-repeat protein At3g23880-like [Lycium ferocissimum]
MESQEDEALPKRGKPTIPSISSKELVLPMPNLHVELITDILLKLPVKSLLKFRPISYYPQDYTHHGVMIKVASTARRGFKDCSLSSLFYDSVTEAFDLDYPGKNPDEYPRVVGSVNGLICLAISINGGLDDLYLWNPSIRKYKKLPSYDNEITLTNFNFGFAYDEFQDDYKVVGRELLVDSAKSVNGKTSLA